jgi:hypothetical protein
MIICKTIKLLKTIYIIYVKVIIGESTPINIIEHNKLQVEL